MIENPNERSRVMRSVKSKNTKPEMKVRRLIHSMGYRYRLHDKSLLSCPDIVFNKKKKLIFIHGCFWHGHKCKRGNRLPASNKEYWQTKLEGNVQRDLTNQVLLKNAGWSILVIWECDLKDQKKLRERIETFLL